MLEDAINYYKKHEESLLKEFHSFLNFRTISAHTESANQMDTCVHWLKTFAQQCGLQTQLWGEKGKSILFAFNEEAGSDKETILFYGHYDVQPADPLEAWVSPPFEPIIREGKFYARGACDDKGQVLYLLAALRAYKEIKGHFPVNIKILIEGEEEIGSVGLQSLLQEKKQELSADHLVFVDGGMEEDGTPLVTLGARGIVCLTVTLSEARGDLHSGLSGGIAYNPNKALVQLLSGMFSSDGQIKLPGFYDEVIEISQSEKKELDFSFDLESYEKIHGFEPTCIEQGISPAEALALRPTLEINGIGGGYTGEGFKTVIPAYAQAKISCRLVPKQIPERIIAIITEYLYGNVHPSMKIEVTVHPGSATAFHSSAKSRIADLMKQSYQDIFEKEPKKNLLGGSIPIASELTAVSGGNAVIIGLCLGEDAIHAPNESFDLKRLEKGYQSIYRLIELFENELL